MELLYLQLCLGAFLLTIGAFKIGAFLLTIEVFSYSGKVGVQETVFLVNHAFARGTPVIFVIFVVSRGLSSKTLVSLVRMQIRHFRRFRQKPPLFGRDKGTVYQKHRFRDPEKVRLISTSVDCKQRFSHRMKKASPPLWSPLKAFQKISGAMQCPSTSLVRACHVWWPKPQASALRCSVLHSAAPPQHSSPTGTLPPPPLRLSALLTPKKQVNPWLHGMRCLLYMGKTGSICHFPRALSASIWGHCSQVLVFTSIWRHKKGVWEWHFSCCFSQHLGILGPPKHCKTRENGKWQIDPALPLHRCLTLTDNHASKADYHLEGH